MKDEGNRRNTVAAAIGYAHRRPTSAEAVLIWGCAAKCAASVLLAVPRGTRRIRGSTTEIIGDRKIRLFLFQIFLTEVSLTHVAHDFAPHDFALSSSLSP